ncbi:MAG: hypothetical protein Kow00109_28800 [Acidobacteriota bacterium]
MGRTVAMTDLRLRQRLEETHRDAFGWALYCCGGDRDQAEDVLQTVYAQVLGQRARFDGRSSFKTWLYTIIRRTAQRERLKLWKRWQRRTEDEPELPIEPGQEQLVYRRELAARLRKFLNRLSPRQQEVLRLVFYHGLTVEEAAGVLGISVGSARTHYERGKGRLAGLLRESGWLEDEDERREVGA